MKVIFCIGESLETRMANDTATFLEHQLDSSLKLLPHFDNLCENLVIAYEPIWAIGTGQVASLQQVRLLKREAIRPMCMFLIS